MSEDITSLSNEELVQHVISLRSLTPLEVELVHRLQYIVEGDRVEFPAWVTELAEGYDELPEFLKHGNDA